MNKFSLNKLLFVLLFFILIYLLLNLSLSSAIGFIVLAPFIIFIHTLERLNILKYL